MSEADFDSGGPEVIAPGEGELILDLEGYEGPLDILLTLAREQKVDLRRISMVALVDQYLAFIASARRLRLEIAADYLVMAAWLAYLKSRLLLPEPPADEEPSGEQMAEALQRQLRLLEAMLTAAAARGAGRATLEVRPSNAAARHLYEKLGFLVAGRRPGYYRFPQEDALILWREDLDVFGPASSAAP